MESIAIDIGNGYVKAVNEQEETLYFPTVSKEDNDKLGATKSNYKISVNGKSYCVGNLAIAKRGIRRWQHTRTINADTLVYVALCSHILAEGNKVNLCLGLPYNHYRNMDKGKQIIEDLTGKSLKTNYKDEEKTIKIEHVSVFPQGVGAYFSALFDVKGKAKKNAEKYTKSLFIDIGYRTVDIVGFEIIDNYFELIEENCFSLEELGTFQVANYITNNLVDVEYNTNDIEYALRNNNGKLENMYGVLDLTELEAIAYKELANNISVEINLKLSGYIRKYPYIFLTGGGAEKLFPLLKKDYPNLKLQDDYVFCNAKGYLALENTK